MLGNSRAIALSARNLAQKTVCLFSDSSFVTCPETRKREGVGGDCWVSSVPFGVTAVHDICAKHHWTVCLEKIGVSVTGDFHLDNGHVIQLRQQG